MIAYQEIRDVHLEISTLCNARCPQCPRNFWGYPFNGGYTETYLSLDQAKQIFSKQFLQQLELVRINGNFGDIVMNPDGEQIVKYFRDSNPDLDIAINTNGGARNQDFWKSLANSNATVYFAIDGLEDTHSLYRQDTLWKTVIKNATTFMKNGGHAYWQFIEFDHNRHQIDECKKLSEELGFAKFLLINDGRTIGPVFDKKRNLSHLLGNYTGSTNFDDLDFKKQNDVVLVEDVVENRTECTSVDCETKKFKTIYIAANGEVSPCCWTGLYPKTYGKGQYYQAVNSQLIPLIKENNALVYPIEDCIKWFNNIEESWKKKSYLDGRLLVCDDNCGNKKLHDRHIERIRNNNRF